MEREGMSACEGEVIETTFQSDGARKEKRITRSSCSESCKYRQVY